MTEHALQRIRERVPGMDPGAVLAAIKAALAAKALPRIGQGVSGKHVCELSLPTGQAIFPILDNFGNVVTVLVEGMDATFTNGVKKLIRSPLAAGLHRMTAEVYHRDGFGPGYYLSASIGKLLINQSPLHAWTAHPRLNPNWEPTESTAFDIGRAAHRAVLGAGNDYVAYPEEMLASNGAASTKAAKEWAEEQREAGRTPLKAEDVDRIGDMADCVRRGLAAHGIRIDPARSELVALAEIDGVLCKAMIDNAPDDPIMIPGVGWRKVLLDLKTIENATSASCTRAVENYQYDFQKQHYCEVFQEASGEDEERLFLFCFVEKEAPHGIGVKALLNEPGHSADFTEDASGKTFAARRLWDDCLKADHWPGYPVGIEVLGARSWHRQAWQDTQQRAALSGRPSAGAIRQAAQWQSPN